jgi:hypothetical protein
LNQTVVVNILVNGLYDIMILGFGFRSKSGEVLISESLAAMSYGHIPA